MDNDDKPDTAPMSIDSCSAAAEAPTTAGAVDGDRSFDGDLDDVEADEQVAAQSITTDEQALAVAATLSTDEWMRVFQGLMQNDVLANPVLWSSLTTILVAREDMEQQQEMPSASAATAASISTADQLCNSALVEILTAEQLRNRALVEAEAKVIEALKAIDAATEECGPFPEFAEARERLLAQTVPLAGGAAQAQRLIHQILQRCCAAVEKVVKKADRGVRDVVVLRCRAICTNPKDRELFLEKAAEAYDGELDKEVRAQLLLAYHKDPTNKKSGFVSNNQVAANRRGGPRPRRRGGQSIDSLHSGEAENTGGSASSSHPNPANTDGGVQEIEHGNKGDRK